VGPPRRRSAHLRSSATAAIIGLAVTWGGTILLLSPAAHLLGDPNQLGTAVLGQVVFWLLAATVIVIVLRWERAPLRSLWLQPLRWQSVGWALALVVINYVLLLPAGEWLRHMAGLSGFAAGMDELMRFPLWYRVLAVVGAGIVEEVLYRGYTVTRLSGLLGSPWLAGLIALIGFSALHVPLWGWGFAVGGLLGGAVLMAFFVWKRDLLSLIIFHTITDAMGLVIVPMYSRWWDAT
jgi:CAAX protease family protein